MSRSSTAETPPYKYMLSNYFEQTFWATATGLVNLIIPVIIVILIMSLLKRFVVGGS